MSSVRCPSCQHEIVLKGVKPGRFHPSCPLCHHRFHLIIPADGEGSPQVVAEVAKSVAPVGASAMGATLPPVSGEHVTAPMSQSLPPVSGEHNVAATMPPVSREHSIPAMARPAADPPIGLSDEAARRLTRPPTLASAPMEMPEITGRLGGYEVKQKLGAGGMGAVYLARQISLDRNVALKVLAPQLANDPQFIARFTREAYAAAQLTHHNVVQIHDIGVERAKGHETNFFSMEFVEGQTLAGLLQETGKLDPEAAVGYILQAARGLKFAHDHGLIHRDIKPENLLLNDQGVVKVADLGLVKRAGHAESNIAGASASNPTASAGVTQISMSMGTPAYMAPEQARDAAAVDHRADIYSLGCTLYDLLTGHPPFVGRTVAEVMTKHATEVAIPPDRLAKHVPGALSFIVMKMMAKRPEERQQSMGEVAASLEEWLGIVAGKPFSPKHEHARIIELAVERFNGSKWNKLRTLTIRGFYAVCAVAIVVLALPKVGHPFVAAGMVGFVLATTVIYQIIHGISGRTFLLSKVRQLMFDSSFFDWLTYLAVIALLVLLLVAFDLHWIWLGFAIAATAVAAGFFFSIDLLLAKDRKPPIKQTEHMLKEMRLHGLDENSLRQFVCKYAGQNWEGFYEAVLGYEAKLIARQAWGHGERGRHRPRHAAWREPVIAWIDRKIRRRHERREAKLLARLESKALRAKGMDERAADKQAKQSANRVVSKAAVIRETAVMRAAETALPTKASAPKLGTFSSDVQAFAADWMHDDAVELRGQDGEPRKHESYFRRRFGSPLDVVLGQDVRLVLAMIILGGFALWWNANSGRAAVQQASQMMGSREEVTITAQKKDVSKAVQAFKDFDLKTKGRQPLRIKHVPDALCNIVGSWNGGLAGALLLLSVFLSGKMLGLLMLLSAGMALFGERLHVPVLNGNASIAAIAAVVIWVIGVFLRRTAGR